MCQARVVFVGGCSAAGKTTLAHRVTETHPRIRYVSGSGLLRADAGEGPRTGRIQAADTEQSEQLQTLIVERFVRLRATEHGTILFDGHYVVPITSGFHAIAPSLFRLLGTNALVVVESDPEEVADRLHRRGDASWWDGTVATVREAIRLERENAERVGSVLGLSVITIDAQRLDASETLLRVATAK